MIGRKVTTLVSATLRTGFHSVIWDGTDVMGRRVAAGRYVAILQQGEFAASTRITLIR